MGNTVPAKLEGNVAIVTGANRSAIAERYAAHGAKVCLTDMDERVEKAAQEIAASTIWRPWPSSPILKIPSRSSRT